MRDDEKKHAIGGLAILVAAVVGGVLGLYLGGNPLAIIVAVAAVVGAGTVEGAQWADNRASGTPTRDVSLRDWAWSAGPGVLAAVIVQLASRAPTWPAWLS